MPLRGKDAPFDAIAQVHRGEAAVDVGHRGQARIGRAHGELPLMEDLERHPGCVFVQGRRVGHLVIVVMVHLTALLHHQQGCRLGQVAVQQFVEFMAGIGPGHDCGAEPHHGHQPQHQRQQARLQRAQCTQPVHAVFMSRSTT